MVCMASMNLTVPQTPEFSTIRSFPGVVAATLREGLDDAELKDEGTPPKTPSTTGTWPARAKMGSAARKVRQARKSIIGCSYVTMKTSLYIVGIVIN